MRGKVVKLLNRYCAAAKINRKDLRRMWRGMTSRERFTQRKEMERQMKEVAES